PVADLPQGVDVLPGAFSTDVGVESDPLQAGGGFIWYEVGGVTPARDRTLDEVKDRVETRWRDDQIGVRLKTRADEIVEKLKAGKTFAEAIEGTGLKVETAANIKRSGTEKLPQAVVSTVFRTAKDSAGTADGKDGTERYVFKVTDITAPAYNAESPENKKIGDAFKAAISDELLSQYITKIESELGSTINRAALNQALTTAGAGN
ncbi:MAG TPA: peptidylprolyl isomerase, partial [Xanthobacteraceae bacterium]|nr:peptidylprolyl isomerase [Xanthobacteraceae bacterium]